MNFQETCQRRIENGCPDPLARPDWSAMVKRGEDDYEALWHHARNMGAWGDLGWMKARELELRVQQLEAIRQEVHNWIVCACISSPSDMMQNAARIAHITMPDESR